LHRPACLFLCLFQACGESIQTCSLPQCGHGA
jgi:hypothetical protein